MKKLDTQPPEGSSFWEGKSPKDGAAVYQRTCRNGLNGTPVYTTFVATGNVPAVDPEVVARQAVSKMKLSGPEIASPRPAGSYVVGVPTWMWVEKSPTTYGPNTTSATASGVTVTATAEVTQIVWNMGDGAQVTCNGPGTPYAATYGRQESPTCGHTYTRTSASQDGGKFAVTATATWPVNWQVNGDGEAGQFTEIRQSQEQVAIGELQVVR
ncbi:ATP/GTP-binding protein [Streptomyces sp. NPDC058239]|uniref:ATP/GTP-binding protein n=1 Tax=Streptomyces sp. NPDC058239 TaxID=3346395 RepID=UPI0036E35E31